MPDHPGGPARVDRLGVGSRCGSRTTGGAVGRGLRAGAAGRAGAALGLVGEIIDRRIGIAELTLDARPVGRRLVREGKGRGAKRGDTEEGGSQQAHLAKTPGWFVGRNWAGISHWTGR